MLTIYRFYSIYVFFIIFSSEDNVLDKKQKWGTNYCTGVPLFLSKKNPNRRKICGIKTVSVKFIYPQQSTVEFHLSS